MRRSFWWILLIVAALLGACDNNNSANTPSSISKPANAIEVSIIYAPESAAYLPDMINAFNQTFANGTNPVTGQALASGEKPIYIVDLTNGKGGSSGTVEQGIVNAIIAPNNQNVAKPVIFAPSVSHWLALANYDSGRQLFDLADAKATALAPVVMAIWESRLNAIRKTVGYNDIGWKELLDVLKSKNGWQDYGIQGGRRSVYYGHTNPKVSSTGLSSLIAEFYASARTTGFQGARLTMEQVDNTKVQDGVRSIEQLIRHYSERTTEFKEYIAQGPDFLDFVALEENDLIYINQGKTAYKPPEKLVALYPKEGTFWHEHPFGIVNADWTTQEQRDAARVFTDYVLLPDQQKKIMEQGFRPANTAVKLETPFVEVNGVTVEGPKTILDVPAPDVIKAIQQNWSFVKKQADILLLIDISGSMGDKEGDFTKIEQARKAAEAFIEKIDPNNRVGLMVFSSGIELRVPLDNLETNKEALLANIRNLEANGGTALFAAVRDTVDQLTQESADNRIRAVVLLSDGNDDRKSRSDVTIQDATRAITASRESLNPIILIPVAYGKDADVDALNTLARSSNTKVQLGDPANILNVLNIIGSYF